MRPPLAILCLLALSALALAGCGVVGKKGLAIAPAITEMKGGAATGSGSSTCYATINWKEIR